MSSTQKYIPEQEVPTRRKKTENRGMAEGAEWQPAAKTVGWVKGA